MTMELAHGIFARMIEIDVRRGLREFAMRLDEARLEMNDIFAQRVILRLNRLVVILQRMQLPNLLLEFLDISFFALSEGTLLVKSEQLLRKPWVREDG